MKKLVLFIAVIAAVSFASCKKTTEPAAVAADSTTVVEEVPADTATVADTAVVAQ